MRLGVVAVIAVAILAAPAATGSTPFAHVIASAPTWSPDGGSLAYTQEIPTANPRFAVVLGSTAGARRRVLVTAAARPEWSPEGGAIAYIGRDESSGNLSELWIADVSSLIDGRSLVAGDVGTFAWSADGERIFYDDGNTCGPLHVVSSYDFRNPRVVVTGAAPAPSPDGRLLAYLTAPAPGDCTGAVEYLSVAHVDGTAAHVVLREPAVRVSWSPDSARLAVEVQSDDGPRIVLVDADGSHRTFVAFGTHPAWSPDPLPRCTIAGGPGGNFLVGTPRRDVIWGYGGADRISGGAGDDDLHGGSGNDVLVGGRGRDVLAGGSGSDVIFARDESQDAVYCGSGYDVVVADLRDDVARDCERVVRR